MKHECPNCGCQFAEAVLSDREIVQSETTEKKLEKPAQVGNTVFGVGVSEHLAIERAQREYEYQQTPERQAERMKRVQAFIASLDEIPPLGESIADRPHDCSADARSQSCQRCGYPEAE